MGPRDVGSHQEDVPAPGPGSIPADRLWRSARVLPTPRERLTGEDKPYTRRENFSQAGQALRTPRELLKGGDKPYARCENLSRAGTSPARAARTSRRPCKAIVARASFSRTVQGSKTGARASRASCEALAPWVTSRVLRGSFESLKFARAVTLRPFFFADGLGAERNDTVGASRAWRQASGLNPHPSWRSLDWI
jgi:hypothetical protein